MKKTLYFLALMFLLCACSSSDDNNETVSYELLPIAYCHMPYKFVSGQTYHITLFYKLPSECDFYKGIYYGKDGNTRTIAIQSGHVQREGCADLSYSVDNANEDYPTAEFDFTASGEGTYTFRFWTGKDASGHDTYYEEQIPVVN